MNAFVRRWRWPLALVIALVAVLPAKWFNDSVLAYDGLGLGPSGWFPKPFGPDDLAHSKVETMNFGSEIVFEWKPNGTFAYGFSLANRGDRSVRVTSLPIRGNVNLDVLAVRIGDGGHGEVEGGGAVEKTVPFRPFTMKPGTFRFVEFAYRLAACPAGNQGGRSAWHEHEVEFDVAGISRTRRVAHDGVVIDGAPAPCPARVAQVQRRSDAGMAPFVADDAVGISRRP